MGVYGDVGLSFFYISELSIRSKSGKLARRGGVERVVAAGRGDGCRAPSPLDETPTRPWPRAMAASYATRFAARPPPPFPPLPRLYAVQKAPRCSPNGNSRDYIDFICG